MEGGTGTQEYFRFLQMITNFYSWISRNAQEGIDSFIFDTTAGNNDPGQNGLPMYFASQQLPDNDGNLHNLYLEITPNLDSAVLQGTKQATTFTWNGQTYNIIGLVSTKLTVDKTINWTIEVPVGV